MDLVLPLLVLGAVIGANNLAVSLALGSLGQSGQARRIVPTFGVFEFTMPLVGLSLGRQISDTIAQQIAWLSPALLIVLGASTLVGALYRTIDAEALAARMTHWLGLVLLSAGLSLDNLIVGFSLGLRGASPLLLATTISVFSMLFAALGLSLGQYAHESAPRLASAASGALLILLGIALALGLV